MKVGIQILNFNGKRWLPGLLHSLEQSKLDEHIVYLVDNSSSDESVSYVTENFPDVVILRNTENLGYAAAYNQSIPVAFAAGCDWVCLLNTDTLVEVDWLMSIAAAADSDPGIGVMGPVFSGWDSTSPSEYMKARHPDVISRMGDRSSGPVDTDWVEGSVFFISKDCYAAVGELNPLYFMYWEEADYCRRARLAGWRVVIVPGSVCQHFAGGSGSVGDRLHALQTRNHLYYKLTDPGHGFSRNLLGALRLAVTYFKQSVWDKPSLKSVGVLCGALVTMCWHLPRCFRVWKGYRVSL